jgi:hypothetical protein
VWTGACNSKGYACVSIDGASRLAHRVVWEAANGPIPDGLTIDHLCRVRNCVNAAHLELVSGAENNRRRGLAAALVIGGECAWGHRITQDNLYRHPRGHMECRECRRARAGLRRAS